MQVSTNALAHVYTQQGTRHFNRFGLCPVIFISHENKNNRLGSDFRQQQTGSSISYVTAVTVLFPLTVLVFIVRFASPDGLSVVVADDSVAVANGFSHCSLINPQYMGHRGQR